MARAQTPESSSLCAPAIAAWAALATACSGGGPGDGAVGPNVLLLVIDTLGADHLGSYGASGDPSPNLDRLASHGMRFERATSTAPWTQPSVASVFTSQMPPRHGVRNLAERLSDDAVTMAEEFDANGYETHGIVSHFLIDREFGFHQGFTTWNAEPIGGHDAITAAPVTDAALAWLDTGPPEPFFLFVHYFDPHVLYHHHADFDRTSAYRGPLAPAMAMWDLRDRRPQLTEADVDYLVGLYREEIAYTDHHVGRLLARLEETGLDRRTLTAVVADHGEEFMRHGWIGHTRTLYDDLVRVPLILHQPGVIPRAVITAPVSLIDLLPTFADLLALDARAADRWEGRSLASLVRGDLALVERPVFAEVTFDPSFGNPERVAQKRANKTAVLFDGLKLIHDRTSGRFELYDPGRDPHEQDDLWGRAEGRGAHLRELLEDYESGAKTPDAEAIELSDEDLQRLRNLGYGR